MKAFPANHSVAVGEWTFHPASCELRRGDEVRRIEPRAARALEVLCEAEGEPVSQEQLVARVWDGRALSENSVSVVIGQLRRALDDDAREPKILETIPKRGYRLRLPPAPVAKPKRGSGRIAVIFPLLIAALAAVWAFTASRGEPPMTIEVRDVANETGEARHAPLARAASELIVDRLDDRGFATRRRGPANLRLQPKLIIWDGKPFLSMTATDKAGAVRWSTMLDASPGKVPPGVEKAFDDLAAKFPAREGTERLANVGSAR